ncbi:MAG: hypothetical protein L0154_30020 [Chloroflexi bacterium]|nr:hypothetical protein [Chloroflexota bacterium]
MSTVALDKSLDKLNADPCESMAVGNHKGELIALQTSFQYGSKLLPFEMKPVADVADAFRMRFLALEILNLPLRLILLSADKCLNMKQALPGRCPPSF